MIYADNAATTKMSPVALAAMLPALEALTVDQLHCRRWRTTTETPPACTVWASTPPSCCRAPVRPWPGA